MTPISIRGLRKTFGRTVAVDDVDLDIAAGDLFFLLGPSGCGKTTILRMIAGFIPPTQGAIHFAEDDVTARPPNKRQTGMVFQSYALWPHMTVRQNVAFGLDVRKRPADEKRRRVDTALRNVEMLAYAERKPNQLSGGQQQRVALARALVVEPRVLLLDEPLSNLDARLRVEMRGQIREICKQAGITAVYVTHDQKEALSMADRVAVLRAGGVVQVGLPRELYQRPAGRFVADFLGETNFLSAEIKRRQNGVVVLESPAGTLYSTGVSEQTPATGNVTCSIRPETIRLARHNEGEGRSQSPGRASDLVNTFQARRTRVTYLGELAQHHLQVGENVLLKVFELNPTLCDTSADPLTVSVDADDVVILND